MLLQFPPVWFIMPHLMASTGNLPQHSEAERERKKILDPEGPLIQTCDWIALITGCMSSLVGVLFVYIPVIDNHNKCLDIDRTSTIVLCVLRSVLDSLYFPCIVVCMIRWIKEIRALSFRQNFHRFCRLCFDVFSIYPEAQLLFSGVFANDPPHPFWVTPIIQSAAAFMRANDWMRLRTRLWPAAIYVYFCTQFTQNLLLSTSKKREEKEMKENDTEALMSSQNISKWLRKRIRQHEDYKWRSTWFDEQETLICNLPKRIRRDLKRHHCSALLKKVPQFETTDSYLLHILCERLKPVPYIKDPCIFREGKPIEEMIFIKRGNLQIKALYGRIGDVFTPSNLKDGDFCGEELVTWALDPNYSSDFLPISTKTVETVSDVEVYVLMADDLKFIASQHHAMQLYLNSRLYHWSRTRAACKIQKAWSRHRKTKMEQSLSAAEASSQSAPVMAVGTPSLSTIFAPGFATNGLPSVWENGDSSNSSARRT